MYFLKYMTICYYYNTVWEFPAGSAGKESACNAGDPGSIPQPERYAGKGIGYPLQYSWVFLVGQLLKNLPAMWEIPGLGRSPGEGNSYPLQYPAWRIPWTIQSACGVTKSQTRLTTHSSILA